MYIYILKFCIAICTSNGVFGFLVELDFKYKVLKENNGKEKKTQHDEPPTK